ncbi:MAG: DUF4435 domain-containing protein [Propionibacteriaceae bacterium]|jgi:energy-coupling factor transporter ATP-binding protein EcfA2|nr:DUF4435 domain-containing protein [Propionibacteriaceae bacterium]
MSKTYAYWLPPAGAGAAQELETPVNSVVIIGANGSGKSRLGAWIEQAHPKQVWRLSALRDLTFVDTYALVGLGAALNQLEFGHDGGFSNHDSRYEWSPAAGGHRYTTGKVSNFEQTLVALFAKLNEEAIAFVDEARRLNDEGKASPPAPLTAKERLLRLWGSVFPQRTIALKDGKVAALPPADCPRPGAEYSGGEMSDGERAGLYVMAQVLCIPDNRVVIVDEPELHLHRSIMERLWKMIERERPDCLFLYITHDTQFAAVHPDSDKIWVKSYDGTSWDWEKLHGPADVPEQLLLDILGNRRDVLFVEGERGSLDQRLYSLMYPQCYVVPCGSCEEVIRQTKAFTGRSDLHHLDVHGIVDRDFRPDDQVDSLQADGVRVLPVAEVENLFLTEGVLGAVARHLELDQESVDKAKDFIVSEKFKNQAPRLVGQAFEAEVRHVLGRIDFPDRTPEAVRKALATVDSQIMEIHERVRIAFDETCGSYEGVLRLLNDKDVAKSVGRFFRLDKDDFCKLVLRLLRADGPAADQIRSCLEEHLPRLAEKCGGTGRMGVVGHGSDPSGVEADGLGG